MLWVEVQFVNAAVQMVRDLQFRFDKRPVDEEFRRNVRELALALPFNGRHHRREVPLHVVDAGGQ